MSRLHPFDLVMSTIAESHFPEIAAEATSEHRNTRDLGQFASSPLVQHVLQDMEAPDPAGDPAAAGIEYLNTLFVSFHFWVAGRQTLSPVRRQLEGGFTSELRSVPDVPAGAVYVQLPDQWFWAQVGPDAPHEPVDGMFIVESVADTWTVQAVLGLRAERHGFSQVTLTVGRDEMLAAPTMARTPPFAPIMPGGSAADLRSLTTAAELVHLAALAAACAVE